MDQHEHLDIMRKMRDELPETVVNCFMAAGYDNLKCISKMSEKSIDRMEKYIDSVKEHYPNCQQSDSSGKPIFPREKSFQFPPGHREQIMDFIVSVKQLLGTTCDLHDPTSPPAFKKKKVANSSVNTAENIPAVVNEIRLMIRHWARNKKHCLQEGVDYSIEATKTTTTNATVVSIICKCNRSYRVTIKPNGKRSISNWTKHFHACTCDTDVNTPLKQITLQSYFTESSAESSVVTQDESQEASDDDQTDTLSPLYCLQSQTESLQHESCQDESHQHESPQHESYQHTNTLPTHFTDDKSSSSPSLSNNNLQLEAIGVSSHAAVNGNTTLSTHPNDNDQPISQQLGLLPLQEIPILPNNQAPFSLPVSLKNTSQDQVFQ